MYAEQVPTEEKTSREARPGPLPQSPDEQDSAEGNPVAPLRLPDDRKAERPRPRPV